MSLPVFLRPEPEADAQTARNQLDFSRAGLGLEFLSRLREVFGRIEVMPQLHGTVWQDVRAARLKRFRFVVYYVVFAERVEVLAIMHGARDSSIWQSRA